MLLDTARGNLSETCWERLSGTLPKVVARPIGNPHAVALYPQPYTYQNPTYAHLYNSAAHCALIVPLPSVLASPPSVHLRHPTRFLHATKIELLRVILRTFL